MTLMSGSVRRSPLFNLQFSIFNLQSYMSKAYRFSLLLLGILCVFSSPAQDRSQARSMVITRYGIVATEHPIASQIGATILSARWQRGRCGRRRQRRDGRFRSDGEWHWRRSFSPSCMKPKPANSTASMPVVGRPRGSRRNFLKAKGITVMPTNGIYSVTVPGAVDGWDKLESPFRSEETFHASRAGHSLCRRRLSGHRNFLQLLGRERKKAAPETPMPRRRILPQWPRAAYRRDISQSRPRLVAQTNRQPWPQSLLRGRIAKRILACSSAHGGTMTADDLAKFSANGSNPSQPPITAGRFTNCRRTDRALARS